MNRRLNLRRESLSELSPRDLRAAVAGRVDEAGPSRYCLSVPECMEATLLPPCYATLGYPCCDSACCTG